MQTNTRLKLNLLNFAVASTAILGTMIATAPQASALGFIGGFAPVNWTLTNTNADGTAVISNAATGSATVTGGDNGSGLSGTTDWTAQTLSAGTVSFSWLYQTIDNPTSAGIPSDPSFYLLNGVATALGVTDGQTGTGSVLLNAGDVFGFRVTTIDNLFGSGVLSVNTFDFQASAVTTVPWETDSLPIIGSGVLLGFGIFAKRKFAKHPQI